MTAARARARGMTRWPPATSVSLLAVATTLPALSAASTGRRLTTPPVPTITRSTSSRVASASSASAPATVSVPPGRSAAARALSSASATADGRNLAACSVRRVALEPAASATTSKASLLLSRTSRVCRPIEPVEPRSATRRRPSAADGAAACSAGEDEDIQGHDRCREDERIDPVADAAVAWDQGAGVLGPRRSLEHGFREVARLGRESRDRPEQERVKRVHAEAPKHDCRHDRGRDHTSDEPLDRLRRRDVGQEFGPPEVLADEVGARVVRPHGEDEQQDPASFGAERVQWRIARHRRGRLSEADDERQQRDVERTEHGRHPGLETLAWLLDRERRDRDQDRPDGRKKQSLAAEEIGQRGDDDNDEREHGAKRREGRVAGAAEKPEGLDRGEDREDGDAGGKHEATEGEHDEQDGHEHGRTDRPLSHRVVPTVSGRSGGGGWRTREVRRRMRRDRSPARGPR